MFYQLRQSCAQCLSIPSWSPTLESSVTPSGTLFIRIISIYFLWKFTTVIMTTQFPFSFFLRCSLLQAHKLLFFFFAASGMPSERKWNLQSRKWTVRKRKRSLKRKWRHVIVSRSSESRDRWMRWRRSFLKHKKGNWRESERLTLAGWLTSLTPNRDEAISQSCFFCFFLASDPDQWLVSNCLFGLQQPISGLMSLFVTTMLFCNSEC